MISEYFVKTLLAMSLKVIRNLTKKYTGISERLGEIMGGKILEYEAKTIMNEGRARGRQEGRAEGEGLLAALISKLFESGRMKDARRAAEDEEARKRFYREFGMIDE